MNDLDAFFPAIRAGDTVAFGRWLAGAEGTMRLSLRSFAAQVDTEAVLQESLLRVWQVAPRFVPDGRANGLLRLGIRIARNLAISEKRRVYCARIESTGDDAAFDEAATLADAELSAPDPMLRAAIAECRASLPEKPALALEARLASSGAEPDETLAARLAMRTNTFLQNFTRARKLLAECLQKRGIDLATELR